MCPYYNLTAGKTQAHAKPPSRSGHRQYTLTSLQPGGCGVDIYSLPNYYCGSGGNSKSRISAFLEVP